MSNMAKIVLAGAGAIILVVLVAIAVAPSSTPTNQQIASSAPQPSQIVAQDEIVPPLPRFTSISECEQAYGAGACGTGQQVYAQNNMSAPQGSGDWVIPFAFGAMTGALLNQHFMAPMPYSYGMNYGGYTSPASINRYTSVNKTVVNNYNSAPAAKQQQAIRSGPVAVTAPGGRLAPPTGNTARLAPPTGSPSTALAPRPSAPVASAPRPTYSAPPSTRSYSPSSSSFGSSSRRR